MSGLKTGFYVINYILYDIAYTNKHIITQCHPEACFVTQFSLRVLCFFCRLSPLSQLGLPTQQFCQPIVKLN